MAEDPVINLLRQHFKKVHECLQDKKNFDILTRFSFRSTCDKAIDDDDFRTDNDYINPEFELSQKMPAEDLQDTTFESFDSEEFQAETDFEEYNIERSVTEVSSSVLNSSLSYNDRSQENSERYPIVPYQKISRKSLFERPQTPMLEMYDSEEESEYYDTMPRKIEGSKKFILYPEQLQAGDLNFSTKHEETQKETIDRSEILEILPRKEKPEKALRISPEENERAFHEELEMYKRDIKWEKTIKSLSYNDANSRNQQTTKIQPPSSSYDGCSKNVNHGYTADVMEKPFNLKLHNSFGPDVPQDIKPEYLKHYFEESQTNVCRKNSQYGGSVLEQSNYDGPHPDTSVDSEIREFVDEKILGNSSFNDESDSYRCTKMKVAEKNYVTMNHLEIQKEMMKRIEEMYKPGDGK